MTPKKFKKTLREAGLSVRAAAIELDMSVRQAYRYTSGDAEIPKVVEYAVYWLAHRHAKGGRK